jgi:hypothetical protein
MGALSMMLVNHKGKCHPHDKNAKFYRAQVLYKLYPELHRRLKRGEPAFFVTF